MAVLSLSGKLADITYLPLFVSTDKDFGALICVFSAFGLSSVFNWPRVLAVIAISKISLVRTSIYAPKSCTRVLETNMQY